MSKKNTRQFMSDPILAAYCKEFETRRFDQSQDDSAIYEERHRITEKLCGALNILVVVPDHATWGSLIGKVRQFGRALYWDYLLLDVEQQLPSVELNCTMRLLQSILWNPDNETPLDFLTQLFDQSPMLQKALSRTINDFFDLMIRTRNDWYIRRPSTGLPASMPLTQSDIAKIMGASDGFSKANISRKLQANDLEKYTSGVDGDRWIFRDDQIQEKFLENARTDFIGHFPY